MTSQRDSHTITDVKPGIISGVQTGNGIPHDKYNKRGIAHVRTNRKDDIFMQRQLYIDDNEAHMALDIFLTAPPIRPLSYYFFLFQDNLQHFPGLNCPVYSTCSHTLVPGEREDRDKSCYSEIKVHSANCLNPTAMSTQPLGLTLK